MRYVCMSFGWFQELLAETTVPNFAAAEAKLLEMLDRGGMIVHVYRETDQEHPELVGRHRRLRSFNSGNPTDPYPEHEVESFMLDKSHSDA